MGHDSHVYPADNVTVIVPDRKPVLFDARGRELYRPIGFRPGVRPVVTPKEVAHAPFPDAEA